MDAFACQARHTTSFTSAAVMYRGLHAPHQQHLRPQDSLRQALEEHSKGTEVSRQQAVNRCDDSCAGIAVKSNTAVDCMQHMGARLQVCSSKC